MPSIDTDLKDNVIRVSQKIQKEEEKRGTEGGYQFIDDVLRARLVANDIEDLKTKVMIFENIPGIKVIKYKPKFDDNPAKEL